MTARDDLIERLKAYSSSPARDTAGIGVYWNLCDEAAAMLEAGAKETERMKVGLSELQKHYAELCLENRPSVALHEAAVSEQRERAEKAERDVFASAVVKMQIDKTEELQGTQVDKSTKLQGSDPDGVICPNCVTQFHAIPENVQAKLRCLETELAEVRRERDALREDAERYRWLREHIYIDRAVFEVIWHNEMQRLWCDREHIDERIDSARREKR